MTVGALVERFPDPATWSDPQRPVDAATVVCVGTNIPVEPIRSRGLRPAFLGGALMAATPHADEYLEGRYGAEFRSVLEQLLTGAADNAALIVLDRRFRDLFYYLKEMVRLGQCPNLPPLHMFDLILSRSFDQTDFNTEQLRLLDTVLTRVAGDLPGLSADDVIREDNAWRAEVRALLAFRRDGAIDGVDAFRALGAARVLSRSDHLPMLAALNTHLAGTTTEAGDRPRAVLLAGEPLFHDQLHRAVEAAGAVVVAEDSEWGSRLAGRDVPEGGGTAGLLDKYWDDATGPELRPFEARVGWLLDTLDEYRPDIVVLWLPPTDVRFGWDYPRLVEHIRDKGAQPVLLRSDVLSEAGIHEAVTEFGAAVGLALSSEGIPG
jgi:hypothetical protein